jgi:hypothetical protein
MRTGVGRFPVFAVDGLQYKRRTDMQRNIAPRALVIVFIVTLVLSMAATAQAADSACSLARAAGTYGFTDNGTVVNIGPRTAVGTFTLDAAGNVLNGVATSSLNGIIADEMFSGTYTVNANCAGTISVEIFSSGTELFAVTLNIAFDHNMKELRGIFTSVVAPDGTSLPTIINIEARKQ